MDYRSRFYERYSSTVQRRTSAPTLEQVKRSHIYHDVRLRGWLPANKDANIIDVACGFGEFLQYLRMRGYTNVQGIDISPEQVALARQLHPNVQQGEMCAFLQAHRVAFDLIVGADIVEHLKKDEILTFLDLCYAALRPGGRLILQTLNGESPFCGENHYGDFTHETCLNPKSMGQLFHICGFEDYEAREAGPAPHGLVSTVRFVLWKIVRFKLLLMNRIETGCRGSGVCTRVFLGSGVRR